jgi:hypothetical protein
MSLKVSAEMASVVLTHAERQGRSQDGHKLIQDMVVLADHQNWQQFFQRHHARGLVSGWGPHLGTEYRVP